MSEKPVKSSLYEDEGHLLARPQPPRKLGTPKSVGGLAAGDLLGKDPNEIIVFCNQCTKPLMIIYPIEQKTWCSTYQKPAKPLGDFEAPDLRKSTVCPICGGQWAIYNDKQNSARYKTSHGII